MEIICINDIFSQEVRAIYEQYGVVTPREGVYYSVRNIVISRKGIGFLLNELINPKIPIGEGENGFMVEPNFNTNRFANLDGSEITQQQLNEFKIKQSHGSLQYD